MPSRDLLDLNGIHLGNRSIYRAVPRTTIVQAYGLGKYFKKEMDFAIRKVYGQCQITVL